MKGKYLVAVALLSINALAWGQTACPGGVPAGDPRCGPSPSWHGVATNPPPSTPQPRWATRWGAIAVDDTNSSVGTVTGMSSKKKAEKAAMKQCRAKGGGGCRIEIAYGNQCGVIAWGDNHYSTASEVTITEASEVAIKFCSQYTQNCRIYYADCSLPERIQ